MLAFYKTIWMDMCQKSYLVNRSPFMMSSICLENINVSGFGLEACSTRIIFLFLYLGQLHKTELQ